MMEESDRESDDGGLSDLAPAAQRALKEAEERRNRPVEPMAPEIGGRKGPEPTRFGDWEKDGIVSDF